VPQARRCRTAGLSPAPPPLPRAPAAAKLGAAQASQCVKQLSDASSACSAALNGANKVAYGRLDRVFGSRGNSAFRLDTGRFFRLAVSQDIRLSAAPEPSPAPQRPPPCPCVARRARG
jgi:hypothetical protein